MEDGEYSLPSPKQDTVRWTEHTLGSCTDLGRKPGIYNFTVIKSYSLCLSFLVFQSPPYMVAVTIQQDKTSKAPSPVLYS